jgi:hypothetical protein
MYENVPGMVKKKFMEAIMMNVAPGNCSYWGTHLYGGELESPTSCHLDGRGSIQQNDLWCKRQFAYRVETCRLVDFQLHQGKCPKKNNTYIGK